MIKANCSLDFDTVFLVYNDDLWPDGVAKEKVFGQLKSFGFSL